MKVGYSIYEVGEKKVWKRREADCAGRWEK
jgi:hypothetical protein